MFVRRRVGIKESLYMNDISLVIPSLQEQKDEHSFSFLFSIRIVWIASSWINISTAQSIAKNWMLLYLRFLIWHWMTTVVVSLLKGGGTGREMAEGELCPSIEQAWLNSCLCAMKSLQDPPCVQCGLATPLAGFNVVPPYNKLPPHTMWEQTFLSLRTKTQEPNA